MEKRRLRKQQGTQQILNLLRHVNFLSIYFVQVVLTTDPILEKTQKHSVLLSGTVRVHVRFADGEQ